MFLFAILTIAFTTMNDEIMSVIENSESDALTNESQDSNIPNPSRLLRQESETHQNAVANRQQETNPVMLFAVLWAVPIMASIFSHWEQKSLVVPIDKDIMIWFCAWMMIFYILRWMTK